MTEVVVPELLLPQKNLERFLSLEDAIQYELWQKSFYDYVRQRRRIVV